MEGVDWIILRDFIKKIKILYQQNRMMSMVLKISNFICVPKNQSCRGYKCPCYHNDKCALLDILEAVEQKLNRMEEE